MSRRGAQTVTINLDSVMASSGLESCGNARSSMVRQSRRSKVSPVMERLGLFGKGSRGKEQQKGAKERRQNERIYKQIFMERRVQFQSIR